MLNFWIMVRVAIKLVDDFLLSIKDYEKVTLLTATKSMEQNHAGILKEYVEGLLR